MRAIRLIASLAACFALAGAASAEDTFVTLLTGSREGTYHVVGSAIAKAVSEATKLHVTTAGSAGSAENITLVADGGPEIAFAQNDITHWAMTGQGAFAYGARTNIRAIAALYPEHVQLLTLAGSGVEGFAGIKGRRAALGAIGSGVEADARAIFVTLGSSYKDVTPSFLGFADTMKALRGGTADVGMIVAGVPTPAVAALAAEQPVRLVSFTPDELERLTDAHPYFEAAEVPAGTYGDSEAARTPAVRALLITRDDVPERVIHDFTKALFEHLEEIRASHPAAAAISLERAASRLTAPLHPGAARFYREAGLRID